MTPAVIRWHEGRPMTLAERIRTIDTVEELNGILDGFRHQRRDPPSDVATAIMERRGELMAQNRGKAA